MAGSWALKRQYKSPGTVLVYKVLYPNYGLTTGVAFTSFPLTVRRCCMRGLGVVLRVRGVGKGEESPWCG